MAQTSLFVGFVVGVVLLALVVAITGRGGRRYSVDSPVGETETRASRVADWADDPTVLSVVFLLLALGFGAIAVLFMGGGGISAEMASAAGVALVTATLLVVVGYLFYGTYHTARSRGLQRSQAALVGSWVLGLLFVGGVALRLLGYL
ncbi:hypothetical protein GJR96_12205 [Haloferax sp. MBLA0076]|uniref:Uncharacterized protein n=1 Tax=Haloferax litoreum TaxID=2666140 RepID=A0A6A8GIK9_9EURY|nr:MULTISPECIES: hypothetical protein [Haloferax]KAB1194151.1 hypothetical protein Hfx1148_12145 [Haloferax sp. CBA1148]MRX22709.1 hypothetical protein [Haloferax litoreum]